MRKIIGFSTMLLFLIAMDPARHALAGEQSHGKKKTVDIQILTFNIHHAVGIDGVLDMERVANTIEGEHSEIVGLQEVDNHWSERSQFKDQAKWLAKRLDMQFTYAANLDLEPLNDGEHRRQYGTAILSKYPIIHAHNHFFKKIRNTEQRGLLEAKIDVKGNHLTVYNAHLALTPEERQTQVDEVIAISHHAKGPKIIVGDLNATPESKKIVTISSSFRDAFANLNDAYTYYSADGTPKRIDYIFASRNIQISNPKIISTLASDHLPLTAKITLKR